MHRFFVLPPWIGIGLGLGVCGGALWKGGREERIAAVAFLAGWAITLLLRDRRWVGTQWSTLAVDVAFLLVIGAIAMRSQRYWPLVASGFQLLGVVTHVARMLDRTVGVWAYLTAGIIWTQLVLVTMGIGVYHHWRRTRVVRTRAPHAPSSAVSDPGATQR